MSRVESPQIYTASGFRINKSLRKRFKKRLLCISRDREDPRAAFLIHGVSE